MAEAAGHHILVVEDDDFVRDVVCVYLRDEGYLVTSVTNGREMRTALASVEAEMIVPRIGSSHGERWRKSIRQNDNARTIGDVPTTFQRTRRAICGSVSHDR